MEKAKGCRTGSARGGMGELLGAGKGLAERRENLSFRSRIAKKAGKSFLARVIEED